MGAIRMRLAAEFRASWRSWLALALLIGLAGGVAVGAVAGARRTATAYPRFVAWSNTPDLETGGFPDRVDAAKALAAIERFPSVGSWARIDVVAGGFVLPGGSRVLMPQLFGVSDLHGTFFTRVGRAKVLAGRMYDPKAPNEAVVDFATASTQRLHVGEVVHAILGDPFASKPTTVPVRIVGIVAFARVFPAFGANNTVGILELSPAFAPAHGVEPDPALASLEIRLRGGAAGVPAFLRDARRAGLGGMDVPFQQSVRTLGVQRSTSLEAGALWALAAVVLLATGAVLGQSLARQTYLSSNDFSILQAIGMSRGQLFRLGLLRAAIAGAVGGAIAVAVAVLLSPLTPIGLARVAEPHPGFDADAPVLVVGAVTVLALTVLLAAIPAWRAASRGARATDAGIVLRPSVLASAAAGGTSSPVVGAGVRMALEPGRGRTAVPVRSAILGATLAVATLIASLVFWSSLDRLVTTPRLSGYAWDMFSAPPTDDQGNTIPDSQARIEATLKADRNVAGYSRGGFVNLRIGGKSVFGIVTDGTGRASPVIAAGRAPVGADEIALGSTSMRAVGVAIGDRVLVSIADVQDPPPPQPMRVVGEVVVPASSFGETGAGEGAAITFDAAPRLEGHQFSRAERDGLPYLIRFRDGVDADTEFDRLSAKLPDGTYNVQSQKRGDIATLGRITRVPLVLAILLGLIALGTLAQTLVTSVRARRRDLAILKTLGFSRRQVRATVAWQASVLAAVSLIVGIPLGLAAGRWIWRAFAESIAVVPLPVLGAVWIPVTVVATLALANLIAAIPARSAARTKPAVVLRSE